GESVTLADLRPTQWVRARGLVQEGTLHASKIERIREASDERIELAGVIEAMGVAGRSDLWLELCGSRVLIAADAVWKNFGEQRRQIDTSEQQELTTEPKVLEELYDLVADSGESRNLAADQPEIVSQLRGTLAELRGRLVPIAAGTPQSVELDPATGE